MTCGTAPWHEVLRHSNGKGNTRNRHAHTTLSKPFPPARPPDKMVFGFDGSYFAVNKKTGISAFQTMTAYVRTLRLSLLLLLLLLLLPLLLLLLHCCLLLLTPSY